MWYDIRWRLVQYRLISRYSCIDNRSDVSSELKKIRTMTAFLNGYNYRRYKHVSHFVEVRIYSGHGWQRIFLTICLFVRVFVFCLFVFRWIHKTIWLLYCTSQNGSPRGCGWCQIFVRFPIVKINDCISTVYLWTMDNGHGMTQNWSSNNQLIRNDSSQRIDAKFRRGKLHDCPDIYWKQSRGTNWTN